MTTTTPPALSAPRPRYLFVGERPSPLAASRAWTWEDGRVCARTLLDALADAGIAREACRFLNLWSSPGLGPTDEPAQLAPIVAASRSGATVVALGRLVQRELARAGVPHRSLIHPAARGAIRRRAVYHAHVRAVLQHHDAGAMGRPASADADSEPRRTGRQTGGARARRVRDPATATVGPAPAARADARDRAGASTDRCEGMDIGGSDGR